MMSASVRLCALAALLAIAMALGACAPSASAANASVSLASGGQHHTCAVLTSGTLKCWGGNPYGNLGTGNQTPSLTPAGVVALTGAVSLSSGYTHACATTAAGGVKCWGYNLHGEVGNGGAPLFVTAPVTPTGLASGVAAIGSGNGHSCALLVTGGVKCWGYNEYGQLGNGATVDSAVPVDVIGLDSGVAAIAVGRRQNCALLMTGDVRCWGFNGAGQLGVGTQSGPETCGGIACSSTPVPVLAVGSVASITSGGFHACAVMESGAAKCWGANTDGQLGDGTLVTNPSPVDVVGLETGVVSIAAGGLHTCAIVSGGAVKCWGRGTDGELGNGAAATSNVPVDVSGLASGVSALASGYNHSCAALAEGGLTCWGRNVDGQLGDGTTTNRSAPVGVLGLNGNQALDTDSDGCTDKTEIATSPGSEIVGGRRDPLNPWDFYDTNGDRQIDLVNDIIDVALAFGFASGNAGYTIALDRSAPPPAADPWHLGAPDGTIDLVTDVFGVAFQHGHRCL